jgi:PadR family transcriptional regulator, regulatory protein PadR
MDVLQGTLDVLVLRALVLGSMHGFAVSRWISDRTRGVIVVEYAPLYKSLHRLEHDGCITGSWGLSENGRRARYYSLTARGRGRLKTEDADWRQYAAAIFRVLDPA